MTLKINKDEVLTWLLIYLQIKLNSICEKVLNQYFVNLIWNIYTLSKIFD